MAIAPPNSQRTKSIIARIPYTNCAPFFHGLTSAEAPARPADQGADGWEWADLSPRQLGQEAKEGRLVAGPMALADFFRLNDTFERLGSLGIAVRGRCGSALLFSRKPARQLDGEIIAVTEETSTTALLLRLILEQQFHIKPKQYVRGPATDDAEAMLLIGDEALKFRAVNRRYPYETDLAFEWWLWQHLPFVFAVWAVRKDASPAEAQRLSRLLQHQLAVHTARLEELAKERAPSLGLPPEEVQRYLTSFVYRLSEPEERAITQFEALVREHHLL